VSSLSDLDTLLIAFFDAGEEGFRDLDLGICDVTIVDKVRKMDGLSSSRETTLEGVQAVEDGGDMNEAGVKACSGLARGRGLAICTLKRRRNRSIHLSQSTQLKQSRGSKMGRYALPRDQ
jgi:hypothetical protein